MTNRMVCEAFTVLATGGSAEERDDDGDDPREIDWISFEDIPAPGPENYSPALMARFDFGESGTVDFIDEGLVIPGGGIGISWMGSHGWALAKTGAEQE